MTPAEFAREIVIPTVEDFRADRTFRRWAYLSAIAVYHLRDHLAEALVMPTDDAKADRRAVWDAAERIDAAVMAALPSPEPFDVVRAIANGSKHALTRSPRGVTFAAGTDWERPPARAGRMMAGLSMCSDGEGGREIPHDGRHVDLYGAIQATLCAFLVAFPTDLAGCSFDPYPEGC